MAETVTGKEQYTTHKSDLREVKQDRKPRSAVSSKTSWPAIIGGGLLTVLGLKRRSVGRVVLAGLGTDYCIAVSKRCGLLRPPVWEDEKSNHPEL